LQGDDPLATLLFQIASPAHIPWGDTRWQELLHGYAVWVHVTVDSHDENQNHSIVQKATTSMAKHAATSSNLATLAMHVTRMLNELVKDLRSASTSTTEEKNSSTRTTTTLNSQQYQGFSQRISRVAKARATAGALQLLRLFVHPVIVRASQDPTTTNAMLDDAFTYSTRGDLPRDQHAGMPLVHALMDLMVSTTLDNSQQWTSVPEIYDALVLDLQLLLVLCGTQLYQPFVSSFQTNGTGSSHYYMDELFRSNNNNNGNNNHQSPGGDRLFSGSSRNLDRTTAGSSRNLNNAYSDAPTTCWTPQRILQACLEWQVRRPPAPPRSIAQYYATLVQSVVTSQGETLGPDGMYESHLVVQAAAPVEKERENHDKSHNELSSLLIGGNESSSSLSHLHASPSSKRKMMLDATKGVLVLSSTIILLPFRLMSLVWGVWGHHQSNSKQHQQAALAKKFAQAQRTKDVLWVSDSPLAELASCLVLLLVNNHRNDEATRSINQFRTQLFALSDNRWDPQTGASSTCSPLDGLPDLPLNFDASSSSLNNSMSLEVLEDEELRQGLLSDDSMLQVGGGNNINHTGVLQLNFESLFLSFGRTLHTELGAVSLYTMIQSSPSFAESLAVRSDLDTLVLPLLRTLYFSSASKTYMAQDYASKLPQLSSNRSTNIQPQALNANVRNCPFRSQSQLYVIIILLLLFSQDSSFGNDAFRRITVSKVLWYKERTLKNINLGSVLLLTLLRSLLFNLHRLQDSFLLSNCCAVLMNLSPAIVDLHEYAAMRLVSVTVSIMKRHSKLRAALGKDVQVDEDDLSTPLGMYAEVSRTLLSLVKHGMSSRNLERNLHLVYSLVYHQSDLQKLFKEGLYTKSEMERIQSVTSAASGILSEEGSRSATKALKVLETRVKEIVQAADKKRRNEHEDFTFTYEEEQDPEIFFVPYVWDVIVCAVTSSSIEWDKSKIQGFALLEEEDMGPEMEDLVHVPAPQGTYAKDVQDVV
jgi:hypothetical protein